MSNQSTTPPSSQDAPPADVSALIKGLHELDGDDRKAADHIASEICKFGVDLLALLGLPFSPGVLAVAVVMSGERAASGPNTIAGWKKYRDEEAPQAVERILNAILAERSTKENVQEVVDGLGEEG